MGWTKAMGNCFFSIWAIPQERYNLWRTAKVSVESLIILFPTGWRSPTYYRFICKRPECRAPHSHGDRFNGGLRIVFFAFGTTICDSAVSCRVFVVGSFTSPCLPTHARAHCAHGHHFVKKKRYTRTVEWESSFELLDHLRSSSETSLTKHVFQKQPNA
jgi:hypothetical protein